MAQNLELFKSLFKGREDAFAIRWELISNALKYSPDNRGPVICIASQVITNENGEVLYKIDIMDNGIGFEQKNAESIFAIFKRFHGHGKVEGTGIGLAICKRIPEHHNGTIYAHSVPNEGSTFTVIVLPQALQEGLLFV